MECKPEDIVKDASRSRIQFTRTPDVDAATAEVDRGPEQFRASGFGKATPAGNRRRGGDERLTSMIGPSQRSLPSVREMHLRTNGAAWDGGSSGPGVPTALRHHQ
jgi:hypothetical protein